MGNQVTAPASHPSRQTTIQEQPGVSQDRGKRRHLMAAAA